MRRSVFAMVLLLAAQPAGAVEVTLQNDATVGGVPSTPGNFFIPGESAAAWLTSTCNGDVVAARVYWTSQFGGSPASQETSITFFAGGAFPAPGAVLANQGGANAVILAPVLQDTTLNEYRFLDPPVDTQALRVPVVAGQIFIVSLELLNQSSGNPFAPGPGVDTDGCQPGRNAVNASPGGWNDACLLGVPGDFVIQAVVDCTAQSVPTSSRFASRVLGLTLGVLALGGLACSRGRSGTLARR